MSMLRYDEMFDTYVTVSCVHHVATGTGMDFSWRCSFGSNGLRNIKHGGHSPQWMVVSTVWWICGDISWLWTWLVVVLTVDSGRFLSCLVADLNQDSDGRAAPELLQEVHQHQVLGDPWRCFHISVVEYGDGRQGWRSSPWSLQVVLYLYWGDASDCPGAPTITLWPQTV